MTHISTDTLKRNELAALGAVFTETQAVGFPCKQESAKTPDGRIWFPRGRNDRWVSGTPYENMCR